MANFKLGKNAKAYYSATAFTNTTYTVGTEITNVKDLRINLSTEKADISTRASGGWKATAATVKDGTITFTMQAKDSDSALTAIKDAWEDSTEIAFVALDGSNTTGAQGPAGNFTVTNFSRSEGLNEAITYDVELSASSFNGWHTVA